MIITIPDKLIIDLLNVHPDTPVKDAVKVIKTYRNDSQKMIYLYIGEYVVRELLKQ